MTDKKKSSLNRKLSYAILFGLVIGLIVGEGTVALFLKEFIVLGVLNVIGQMFLRILSMLSVPVIMITLINGIARIGDIKSVGKIGGKLFTFYFLTTALASIIAIIFALIVLPGNQVNIEMSQEVTLQTPAFAKTLINIIPENPFKSLNSGNLLPLIVFAVLIGISISILGKKVTNTINLLYQFNKLVLKMFQIVMGFAPIGVFALVINVFVKEGFDTYVSIYKYFFLIILLLAIQFFGIYGLIVKYMIKAKFSLFIKKFRTVALTSFATSSSNATIPVTMFAVRYKYGVSRKISSAVIPLGTVINMDGTAIMQSVAVLFIAQMYNVQFSLSNMILLVLYIVISTFGTAGIPGAGMVSLGVILTVFKLPVEGIAIILSVDRILDMLRTIVNVAGDTVGSLLIAKSENEWNVDIYNDPNSGSDDSLTFEQLQQDIIEQNKV